MCVVSLVGVVSVWLVSVVRMCIWGGWVLLWVHWMIVSWQVSVGECGPNVVQVVVWVSWVDEWFALREQLCVEKLVLAVEDSGVPQVVQDHFVKLYQ